MQTMKARVPTTLSLKCSGVGFLASGSQYFITLGAASHLDGKHCVFGKVKSGYDVVQKIEQVGASSGKPSQPVYIQDCGQIS
jgi:peptidylprolyl isomerase